MGTNQALRLSLVVVTAAKSKDVFERYAKNYWGNTLGVVEACPPTIPTQVNRHIIISSAMALFMQ